MKNYLLIAVYILFGCFICEAQNKTIDNFIPQGYVLVETSYGDLNRDGEEDCILVVKGTNKNNFVINRFDQKVDRNRRGIIVLFKIRDNYELAAENYDCFYSENEDGGGYYAPQLSIYVVKGNLYIAYEHGRYGFRSYRFKYNNSSFELIGYDATRGGAVIDSETNIDFVTKKKRFSENTYEDAEGNEAEGNDAIFKETLTEIKIEKLLKLDEIKDFEELNMSIY